MKESVLPCVSQGLNLGVQACQQAPVSTEPFGSSCLTFFLGLWIVTCCGAV